MKHIAELILQVVVTRLVQRHLHVDVFKTLDLGIYIRLEEDAQVPHLQIDNLLNARLWPRLGLLFGRVDPLSQLVDGHDQTREEVVRAALHHL